MTKAARVSAGSAGSSQGADDEAPRSDRKNVHNNFTVAGQHTQGTCNGDGVSPPNPRKYGDPVGPTPVSPRSRKPPVPVGPVQMRSPVNGGRPAP